MATLSYNNAKVNKLYYQNTEVKKCYYQNVLVHNSFPSTTPGDIGVWDDKEWLVCHYDSTNNQVYLIAKESISLTPFSSGSTAYKASTLASVVRSYQLNNMSAAALSMCVDVTVNNVTAKVFVPTYEQFNGGFSWFATQANRIAYYNGTTTLYWTSSAKDSSLTWLVKRDGSFYGNGPKSSCGFRPCVCVQL